MSSKRSAFIRVNIFKYCFRNQMFEQENKKNEGVILSPIYQGLECLTSTFIARHHRQTAAAFDIP